MFLIHSAATLFELLAAASPFLVFKVLVLLFSKVARLCSALSELACADTDTYEIMALSIYIH
jgi:hypothetical protein